MTVFRIFFIFLWFWVFWPEAARSNTGPNKVVPVFTEQSDSLPVRVISRDFLVNRKILEISEETIESFVSILNLEDLPLERLTLRWTPHSPGDAYEGPVFSFPREFKLGKDGARLGIFLDGPMVGREEGIRRSLIIALLQAVAWEGETEVNLAVLPEPPVWLVEGILWEILKYRDTAWREIVRKGVRTRKLPTLKEIQSWDELPSLEVERAWMQAFSFTLFRHGFDKPAEKRALKLWLREFRFPAPDPFWETGTVTENWWVEVAARPLPDRVPILSWSFTVASLNQLRSRSLLLVQSADDESARKLVRLSALPAGYFPSDQEELREWLGELSVLASKAHFAWRSLISGYIETLNLWSQKQANPEELSGLVERLERLEREIVERQARGSDMLDWATVNLDFGSRQDRFSGYARLVRELEGERRRFRRQYENEQEAKNVYE